MWVSLTRKQLELVDRLVSGPVRAELSVERVFYGKRGVHVHAAFVAWERARDTLADGIFTRKGRMRAGFGYTAMAALRKITAETNMVLKHPALRGTAMQGWCVGTFPVWAMREDEAGRIWWPSPLDSTRLFTVLRPRWHDEHGVKLTDWREQGIDHRGNRLHEEAVHWAVLAQ